MQDTLGPASRKSPPVQQTTLQACWILIGWKPIGPAHHVRLREYIKAANRTVDTADLRRSPRVRTRWFDSAKTGRSLSELVTTASSPYSTGRGSVHQRPRSPRDRECRIRVCEPKDRGPVLACQYRLKVCVPKDRGPVRACQ